MYFLIKANNHRATCLVGLREQWCASSGVACALRRCISFPIVRTSVCIMEITGSEGGGVSCLEIYSEGQEVTSFLYLERSAAI